MRICGKHWAKYWMTVALASVALAGCGGGEESTAGGAGNLAPLISGTPTTSLNAGSPYNFQPQASDPDGDALVFSADGRSAYAVGQRSSRQIERLCQTDVAFRIGCAQDVPDHSTIARFRAQHQTGLGELFTQVLLLCARPGWAGSVRSRSTGRRC